MKKWIIMTFLAFCVGAGCATVVNRIDQSAVKPTTAEALAKVAGVAIAVYMANDVEAISEVCAAANIGTQDAMVKALQSVWTQANEQQVRTVVECLNDLTGATDIMAANPTVGQLESWRNLLRTMCNIASAVRIST